MALRLSTGLVNKLMDTGSFKSTLAGCFIDIFSGVQPASPDDAATGTKLVTLTESGDGITGLTFEAAATNGELEKNAAEAWQGSGVATGTAGWFRVRAAGDTGTDASTTAARLDGAIATTGAEMNVGSLTINTGAPFVLSTCAFTLPKV